jgi:lambda repressor-like predicted transcriptional regulator
MAKGKPTDPKLRAEIVSKIRDEGMSVAVASATYGFSSKTIYT